MSLLGRQAHCETMKIVAAFAFFALLAVSNAGDKWYCGDGRACRVCTEGQDCPPYESLNDCTKKSTCHSAVGRAVFVTRKPSPNQPTTVSPAEVKYYCSRSCRPCNVGEDCPLLYDSSEDCLNETKCISEVGRPILMTPESMTSQQMVAAVPLSEMKWYCEENATSEVGGSCLVCADPNCQGSESYDTAPDCMSSTPCKVSKMSGVGQEADVIQPAKTEEPTVQPTVIQPAEAEVPTVEPTVFQPVEADVPTVEPTVIHPVEAEVPTVEPTVIHPVEAEVPTVEPTVIHPVEAEVPTVEPTVVQPATDDVPTVEPTVVQPATDDVPTVEPTVAQPTTAEVPTVEPTVVQPATDDVPTVEPTVAQPTTAEVPTVEPVDA